MFMSIGVNNHSIKKVKAVDDDGEGDDDMMATQWGADVFEMVDDSDEGDEYDDESDEGDEEKLMDTGSGPASSAAAPRRGMQRR